MPFFEAKNTMHVRTKKLVQKLKRLPSLNFQSTKELFMAVSIYGKFIGDIFNSFKKEKSQNCPG